MNEILEEALNRGAPIDTPILINLGEFLDLFRNEELTKEYRNNMKEVVSEISNIIDMYGGNFALPLYATITMDENNSKVLTFSGENYYNIILELLMGFGSVDEILDAIEDKEKFKMLKEKIVSIKSSKELKDKVPRIHELYEEQLECNENLISLDEMVNDKDIPLKFKLVNLSNVTNNFKELYSEFDLKRETQFARDFTLPLFLKRLMQSVENMIDHADEIINVYCTHTFDLNCFRDEDEDRLNLYIAAQFMEKIESEDVNGKQRYLFYLTNYFKENVETQLTRVKIKLRCKKVTPITLYQKYKKLLVDNPDLLAVNFSHNDFRDMTKQEVEEFIIAYLSELAANWELLPSDDTSIERSVRSIAKRKYKNISEEERRKREKKLVNLYMEKKKFYDETDPYFRIKGKQTFDGYVGYIYANSLVILEKFYDNVAKSIIASNEAVYVMSMKDFYDLSQRSKSYLIANHLCHRVIHKGNWQERVLEYINKDGRNMSPVEDTNRLIAEKKILVKEKKQL